MEIAIFLGNTGLCAWLMYWCLTSETRKPGAPMGGLFAYRTPAQEPVDNAGAPERKRQDTREVWRR